MTSVLAAVVCWIRTDKEHVIPFIFWYGCYKEDYRLCRSIYWHIFHSVLLSQLKFEIEYHICMTTVYVTYFHQHC